MVLVAAGLTWWLDAVLAHRVVTGSDHALRLAAVLTYVGVDGSYTLARAFGLSALIFAYVTMVLGLLPGRARSSPLHRQTGMVTLALVVGHATIPYTSVLPPYGGWRTGFVPFGQPVSWGIRAASWESLGILALYLLLLSGPSFYLLGDRRRGWAALHRAVMVVYALSVAHAFLLGTDFLVAGPARAALLLAQVPILGLLARRLAPPAAAAGARSLRWLASGVAGAGSAGLAALGLLVATGSYAPGMRL